MAWEQQWGPQRQGGQGLDAEQRESGDRAICALLADPEVRDHVDLVVTYRDSAYEVWSRRGLVRFQRWNCDGRQHFKVLEVLGDNPLERTDADLVASCEEEVAAARRSGVDCEDPNFAFIEPEQLSYPHAFERIAQLFDSPFTGDLVISPKCYAFGTQAGQHGALDVVQSRAPLAFAGPGVRPGRYVLPARHVDIAPTICHLMGFPRIDGMDWTGLRASQRGVDPDVYLLRQDGRVLSEIVAEGGSRPNRVYLIVFDGLSHSELLYLWATRSPAIRNLRRILERSAWFAHGSTVNFPSITWPSHSTILTGAWCGHHDVVNPTYYDRAGRTPLAPQAQGIMTEGFLSQSVETLYEAFRRVYGPEAFVASIHEPQSRGAVHAALEQRVVGPRDRLRELTAHFQASIHPRYAAEKRDSVHREAVLDARGLAQVVVLFEDESHPPPIFVAHEFALTDGAGHEYGPHGEGLRSAIAETDARLGVVLDLLQSRGLLESTLFVFTSDHGMAAQRTELAANPCRHLERAGLQALVGEPMVWLRDLAIRLERASDGRTARVLVYDHDSGLNGEPLPVEGAEVTVVVGADRIIARGHTVGPGVFGFPIPVAVAPGEIRIAIRHPEYNPRNLRLDGASVRQDPRSVLFGAPRRERPESL